MFKLYAPHWENPVTCQTLEEAKEKAKEELKYDGKWRFNYASQSWKAKPIGVCIIYEDEGAS